MDCPSAHEWYEAARGMLPRDRDRDLGRHLGDCPDCRDRAEAVRETTASLQHLAEATRTDLSAEAAEALFRRARVRGLLGRPFRRSIGAWAGRTRWVRWGLPAAFAAAALFLVAVGIWSSMPHPVRPDGALEQLVRTGRDATWAEELRPLGPVARAAVSEELARPEPSVPQVADLLLIATIAERPRHDRQTRDVRFLLEQVRARRPVPDAAARAPRRGGPMLGSLALTANAAGEAAGRTLTREVVERPLAAAKRRLLAGDYEAALDLLPADGRGAVLRAWCLAVLGHRAEAALVLDEADGVSGTPLARLVRADLALGAGDVTEAVRHYEDLAAAEPRFWFAAGYLYRYELRDGRAAGECFHRLEEGPLAEYVRRTFETELAMAAGPDPEPLVAVDFDDYAVGPMPKNWTLVRVRGGEFEVVDVPVGRALSQGAGTEFVTGEPEWADYTVRLDVKVLEGDADFAVTAVACRGSEHTGYGLELSPQRLRIIKQIARPGAETAPLVGQTHRLVLPPAEGWWYTLKIRVQHAEDGTTVAGKVWRSDTPEPLAWHVAWTDTGQPGVAPLDGGRAGVQVRGARVLVDNFRITRNVSSEEFLAASP
ncbi:MAG: hypothetical protein R6X20_16160 [Phycisphaerae bacterium]